MLDINFIEREVVVQGEKTLKGTLTLPQVEAEKLPAVLIINGSGSANRDGNIKKPAIEANIYRDLAHFITGLGIITLRYDKRGVGESEGDPLVTGMEDLVQDVVSNIEFLKKHSNVDSDKIILLGHSEGCILATIANTIIPVAGLILLAGAGTGLRESMDYQNFQITEEVRRLKGIKGFFLRKVISEEKIAKQQEDLYNKVMKSTEDVIRYKFKKMPANWLKEHFEYDNQRIQKILKDTQVPVLAITGEKDVQANPEDIRGLKLLNKKNIQGVMIKDMDHMLKEFTGEKTVLNLMKQYKEEASQPMHPHLKEILKEWIKQY